MKLTYSIIPSSRYSLTFAIRNPAQLPLLQIADMKPITKVVQ